ncbi:MAG: M23 family metallopeptidase, partial [Anaerolineae bacterium]
VKKLRADLDKWAPNGDEIILQNPAPGVRISQSFGQRPEVYKPPFDGHEGIDYACKVGTSILAAADGVVYKCGDSQGPYGIRVIVEHVWGNQKGYTVYAHLSSVSVKVGDRVQAGDVVGKSGNTGNSDGAHLHFSLILFGKSHPGYKSALDKADNWYHDPAPFMSGTRGVDEWVEGDTGDMHEEIICLPPTRPEEM